ncbi:Ff.00g065400.m01.CDS01 [Fusarium sp. VM40]|nr:Ff.00g065400.m01.CDS01 [Fusarium sp. VM40]
MACSECFQGHIHDGKWTGKVRNIFGRQTYVATPLDDVPIKGIVVIVPGAYGWEFVNNRLLADHYASRGHFLVYLPDFMDGRPAPLWLLDVMARFGDANSIWDLIWKPWYTAQLVYGVVPFFMYNSSGRAWPRIRSFFEAVRLHEGSERRIGAAGFCWGGRPVMTLARSDVDTANSKPLVDAVFAGHPSGLSLPGDAENVTKPISVAIGDKDQVTPMSQVNVMRSVWQGLEDVPIELVVYPGAGHGFCVRVDSNNKNQFQQSEEAEEQALRWFGKYLG